MPAAAAASWKDDALPVAHQLWLPLSHTGWRTLGRPGDALEWDFSWFSTLRTILLFLLVSFLPVDTELFCSVHVCMY